MVFYFRTLVVPSSHGNEVHIFFRWYRKFVFMLLCNVVKVDVSDGTCRSKRQVQVEILGSIQVYPLLSIWIVSWHFIRLQHLSFQLFLLK